MRPSLAALALCLCAFPAAAHPRAEAARAGPYALELVDEGGATLPTFTHRGRTYVLGAAGARYLVRVRNASPRRVEVVASVDGRDVVDGRPAAFEKRGYLVEPWGTVTIDGFRLGDEAVAAFRFGAVSRSYAARMGDARDVGVVGVAIFPERPAPPPVRLPEPLPWDRGAGSRAPGSPAQDGSAAAGAAPAPRQALKAEAERPGLGTEFGEEHRSVVERTPFAREGARPAALLALRYDDREGLLSLGIDVDRRWRASADRALREEADPFRRERFAEPPPGWRPAP